MAGGSNEEIVVRILAGNGPAGEGPLNSAPMPSKEGLDTHLETLYETLGKFETAINANTKANEKIAKEGHAPTKRAISEEQVQGIRTKANSERATETLKLRKERVAVEKDLAKTMKELKSSLIKDRSAARIDTAKTLQEIRSQAAKDKKDLSMRNSLISSSGIGGVLLGSLAMSLGSQFGKANAQYALTNSLVRPDLAASQLFNAKFGAAQNAASSLFIGGGALLGSMFGPEMAFGGAILGGIAGGIANSIASPFAAGENLNNTAQAFQQANSYYFAGRYGKGMSNKTANDLVTQPGMQDIGPAAQAQLAQYTVGPAAQLAAMMSLEHLHAVTGYPLDAATIASAGRVIQGTGNAANAPGIAKALGTLSQQLQTTRLPPSAMKDVADLLTASSAHGNLNAAVSAVFNPALLSPQLQQQSMGFAQAGPFGQFVSSTIASALLGPKFNLQSALQGNGAQLKMFQKFARNPNNALIASAAFGPAMYNALAGANSGNAQLRTTNPNAAQQNAIVNKIAAGTATGADIFGESTPLTQKQTLAAEKAGGEYTMYADTVNVVGKASSAVSSAMTSLNGGVSAADHMLRMIHKDKS